MKQQSFKHIFILCSLVLFCNSLFAQFFAGAGRKAHTQASRKTEAVLNPKIQNVLTKNYKDAVALTWHNVENNTMIRFTKGSILHRILFTPGGKQIYHISYAEAVDLPVSIVKKVKNYDGSFTIQRGIKVEQSNTNVWIVYAEKKNRLFALRIENDEVELFEEKNSEYLLRSSSKN